MGMGAGRGLIGLDIGSSGLKAAHFLMSGPSLLLRNFLFLPTPSESFLEGGVVLPNSIAFDLKQPWRRALPSRRVCLAVSPQHATLKQFWLEITGETPLSELVKWEMEKYISLPVEEMVIHHQILNEEGDHLEIISGAAPRHLVENLTRVCQLAGLKPVAIEIPYLSLLRLFLSSYRPIERGIAYFLIEVGATQTTVLFIADGILSFVRTIPIAGNSFTYAIGQSLSLTFEEAESLKLTKATLLEEEAQSEPYSHILRALNPVLREFIQEMQRSLDFYQSRSNAALELKVLLFGGSAQLRGLGRYLEKALGAPVELWAPLRPFIREEDPQLMEALPFLGLAGGLALKEFERQGIGDLYEKMGISLLA